MLSYFFNLISLLFLYFLFSRCSVNYCGTMIAEREGRNLRIFLYKYPRFYTEIGPKSYQAVRFEILFNRKSWFFCWAKKKKMIFFFLKKY